MRIKYAKLITLFIIVFNILIVYYTWKFFISINILNDKTLISNSGDVVGGGGGGAAQLKFLTTTSPTHNPKNRIQVTNKHIKKLVTIVFRDIYNFDNDLKNSIECITRLIPSIKILVIFNTTPYPPLDIITNQTQSKNTANIKFINLDYDVRKKFIDLNPITLIRTKYVLFMPDSVRLNSRAIVTKIIREFNGNASIAAVSGIGSEVGGGGNVVDEDVVHDGGKGEGHASGSKDKLAKKSIENAEEGKKSGLRKILAIPFLSNNRNIANCIKLHLDSVNWTIEYTMVNKTERCDMVNIFLI